VNSDITPLFTWSKTTGPENANEKQTFYFERRVAIWTDRIKFERGLLLGVITLQREVSCSPYSVEGDQETSVAG